MVLQPITVECYAGSHSDERPARITTEGRVHHVVRLLSEQVEESLVTRGRTRRYKILTDQGIVLEVIRTEEGSWLLESESAR